MDDDDNTWPLFACFWFLLVVFMFFTLFGMWGPVIFVVAMHDICAGIALFGLRVWYVRRQAPEEEEEEW